MIYVVAGVGSNDLTIPLVLFQTEQEAQDFIDQFPKESRHPDCLDYEFTEIEGIYGEDGTDDGCSEIGRALYRKLFKDGNYYPGCGGIYQLTIIPIEFGQPMVGWDLD